MASTSCTTEKLTYPQKLSRLRERMKDPEWRRYGLLMAAGKSLGIVAILALSLIHI